MGSPVYRLTPNENCQDMFDVVAGVPINSAPHHTAESFLNSIFGEYVADTIFRDVVFDPDAGTQDLNGKFSFPEMEESTDLCLGTLEQVEIS